MKKRIIFYLLTGIFYQYTYAQLTKSNWMVGGNGNFSTASFTQLGDETKTTNLSISPAIGYFFADRFSAGIRVFVSNYHTTDANPTTGTSGVGNDFSLSLGPFARYYLLDHVDRNVNVFVEANYGYGYSTDIDRIKQYLNRFSLNAGPVLYLNNSVGLEFSLGYYQSHQYGIQTTGLQAGLGFQIHLEKEKFK